MNQDISFGIILPTYNRSNLLERALLSVINQSYKNWIVCIVDDGSTDDTTEMIQAYINDPRVHYILQSENLGVNAARNCALDYLQNQRNADYITLLDDDDYFNTDTLLQAIDYINKIPEQQWFVSKRVDESGRDITITGQNGLIDYVYYHLGIGMQGDATHVIKSTLIGEIRFAKQFKQAQEWIFYLALSAKSKMYYYDFPSTVCSYLDDGLSAGATKGREKRTLQDIEAQQLQQKMLKALGYSHATVETLKLQDRINKTLQTKKYHKLSRYLPKFLYWKLLQAFNL